MKFYPVSKVNSDGSYRSWKDFSNFRFKGKSQKKTSKKGKLSCMGPALPRSFHVREIKEKLIINKTDAEKKMMEILKSLDIDYRFQHVLGISESTFRVVDFYLPRFSAVIEVDGGQHYTEKGKLADKERELFLRRNFRIWKIHRFSNSTVIKDSDYVSRFLAERYRKGFKQIAKEIAYLDTQFVNTIS